MEEQLILEKFKEHLSLPPSQEIFHKATRDTLTDNIDDVTYIRNNFSILVDSIQKRAYELYLSAERPAVVKAIRDTLEPLLPENATAEELFELLQNSFWAIDKLFLSLGQGRRPRAGKAFEYVIKVLFDKLHYPYTPQPVINGQPDFLLPSEEHYQQNPMDCIIFTVKRTLRERWRQITTEGTRGYMFFLATIDRKVAVRDLPEMMRNRIYLVVPEGLRIEKYENQQNVISFETFFRDYLDPSMNRWRNNNVIE